ncbi:methyl-accepting chemotaxis protein [Paenibacillus sp. MSJ-6]|uniref:Methyl-accepting chemotaxis protein n=2 Tax=Paenibacillus brevis TaxID=2841508 RepID=A0ABS6FSK9_9BACL|nr:methyl-accepting chemotaxis protein [Paenibacillus brevis]
MESWRVTFRRRSLRAKMIFVIVLSMLICLPISAVISYLIGEFSIGIIINTSVNLLVSTVVIFLVTEFVIINRLKKVLNATNIAASGDLTVVTEVGAKDEIGNLSSSFNIMINNFNDVVTKTNNVAIDVSTYAEEFKISAEQSSSSVTKISTAMQEIVAGSELQSLKSIELLDFSKLVEAEMDNVDGSIQAVTKLSNETSVKADTGLQLIDETIRKMNLIQESVEDSSRLVNSLGNKSNEISNIVTLITSIAEQTNLLALNATIEAARAGEHGRGFAVVAEEVRKLAEESARAGGEIRKLVDEILSQTYKTVQSINIGTEIVEVGRKTVNKTGEAFNDIVNYVHNITHQSEDVKKAMLVVSRKTNQTIGIIEEIATIAEQTSSTIQIVSASMEKQSSSNEEVASSAIILSKTASNLRNEISRFKFSHQ